MKDRTKIKVIKKGDGKIIETPEITEKSQKQDEVSDTASTVSGWINEFQKRRQAEKESAFEQFYS